MPSDHYAAITECLEENMKLLDGASGKSKLENNKMLWNIGSALLILSDALQDEFTHPNTRLTYLEQRTNR